MGLILPTQDFQDAIQLLEDGLPVSFSKSRILQQLGPISLEALDLDRGVLDSPPSVVNRLFHTAIGLASADNQVLAFQLPLDQGSVLLYSPPLFETIFGGDLSHGHTHLAGSPPVGADQPGKVALGHRLVQTGLGQEGSFLFGRDVDAEHVASYVARRRLGDEKDGDGDNDHGQKHEQQTAYDEFRHTDYSFHLRLWTADGRPPLILG